MMVIFLRRRGISLSRTTVLKYMRELKLRSVVMPKKPRYHKGDCYKKFDNLLSRILRHPDRMKNGVRILLICNWQMEQRDITAAL